MATETQLIDGNAIAATVRGELKEKIAQSLAASGRRPGLAVIIVGDRSDSATYVKMKRKAAEEIGMLSRVIEMPATTTREQLLEAVHNINNDTEINGLLVQMPLPSHLNENEIQDAIALEKDVDGFNALNMGYVAMRGREPLATACTPKGCIELLKRSNVQIEGKHAVVIGRSNIVGMPVALLLIKENATVTICHSKTENIADVVKQADIVIAAIGKGEFVRGAWLKPGAVVIDVGMNQKADATKKSGFRFVGDVNFEEAKGVASKITPVPGGVGPMTVAMLLSNTVDAFNRTLRAAGAGAGAAAST